jgi:site-specific recombinase XerD
MAVVDGALSLVSTSQRAELLAELQDLPDQTCALVGAPRAANTVRAYASDWRHFCNWCGERHLQALPASAEVVALYITQLAESRRAVTVQRRLAAISQIHQDAGQPTPTEDRLVRRTMAGIRSMLGTAPRTKTATRTKLLHRLVLDLPDTPQGARDRALLLVGFAGALRRSELVALDRSDIMFDAEGIRVTIRASKTDQESVGAVVGLPQGERPETCPVRALRAWLALLPDQRAPVFRRMSRWGTPTRARLTDQSVALIIKRLVVAVGQDPKLFAGHSLRAGLATSAAAGGATELDIIQQTRHRSIEMVRRYIREGGLFHTGNAARFTGL